MSLTAKVFMTGRSQAVRLPKEFRFKGTEVRIRRDGSAVVLEPIENNWDWLDTLVGTFDKDFIEATAEKQPEQDRPALRFFE